MRTYKIYANLTATATAAANIQFIRGGRIKSIRWEADVDAPADNAAIAAELTFDGGTTCLGTNDTNRSFSELRHFTNLTTSGGFSGRLSKQEFVDVPVLAGEKVYLGTVISGTVACRTTVFLDVAEGSK